MFWKTLASANYVNQVYSNYGLKEDGGSRFIQDYDHNGYIVRKIWVKEVRREKLVYQVKNQDICEFGESL